MKITYELDNALSAVEKEVLSSVLFNRSVADEVGDFDIDCFEDKSLKDMISRYLRDCLDVELLDSYDEADEREIAKQSRDSVRAILSQILCINKAVIEQ